MKHFSKPSLYLVALVAIGCLFYACSDEELSDVSSPVQEDDFTVRVKNGYLEFKDQAAFDEVKASLESMDDEALNVWESQFNGFTSLRKIDEMSIDAQEAWFEKLRNMSEEERVALQQSDDAFWYSDYIKEHSSLFVLQDSGKYRLNIMGSALKDLSLLNKDGIYKIGSNLYLYDDSSTKIIHDGDDSKLELLSRIEESDDDLQISVINSTIEPLKESNNSRYQLNVEDKNTNVCGHKVGDNYVTGEAYIDKYKVPETNLNSYFLYVIATNYYKDGLFGGYTRKRTRSLRITGTLDFYANGRFEDSKSVNVGTGGKLRTRIYAGIEPNIPLIGASPLDEVIGVLNIFGRGGTSCGDVSSDPTNRGWAVR